MTTPARRFDAPTSFTAEMTREERVAVIERLRPQLPHLDELASPARLAAMNDDQVHGTYDGVLRCVELEREDAQIREDRAALAMVNVVTSMPAGIESSKTKLDAAHEKAEAERIEASKGGPPAGAMVKKS